MASNKMPRILALVPYRIFPAHMGGQKGIALFYRALSKRSHLAMLSVQSNEAAEEFPVMAELSNHRLRYIDPSVFLTLRRHSRDQQTEWLLFEHPYYAWLMLASRLFLKPKQILHAHNIESLRFRSMGKVWWPILWLYEALAFRCAQRLWFKTPEDMQYAVDHYGVKAKQCTVIPYGIDTGALPSEQQRQVAAAQLRADYQIGPEERILFFNGTLSYGPNLDALRFILDEILPRLSARGSYRLLVCGKGLPDSMQNLEPWSRQGVIYAGFVEDIDRCFLGCDVFLNPLLDGGGIKTKLVEALGFGRPCVSTRSGAIGVPAEVAGERLQIVDDRDWDAFAAAVEQLATQPPTGDHDAFYAHFHWPRIAARAVEAMESE